MDLHASPFHHPLSQIPRYYTSTFSPFFWLTPLHPPSLDSGKGFLESWLAACWPVVVAVEIHPAGDIWSWLGIAELWCHLWLPHPILLDNTYDEPHKSLLIGWIPTIVFLLHVTVPYEWTCSTLVWDCDAWWGCPYSKDEMPNKSIRDQPQKPHNLNECISVESFPTGQLLALGEHKC